MGNVKDAASLVVYEPVEDAVILQCQVDQEDPHPPRLHLSVCTSLQVELHKCGIVMSFDGPFLAVLPWSIAGLWLNYSTRFQKVQVHHHLLLGYQLCWTWQFTSCIMT